jgi:hypothetical protein
MRLSLQKKLLWVYPFLMLLCGIGYAKYDSYQLDGDAVAFMDISDLLLKHQWQHVLNGYWNPAYSAALALGTLFAHPGRWHELAIFFYVNFFIYLGCIAATLFFVQGLVRLREHCLPQGNTGAALTPFALTLSSLGLLLFSFQRELSLGKVRADALLLFFLLLAAGVLLRLQSGARFYLYPLLGFTLGLAYLTKSFAFLPSCLLLLAIFIFGLSRKAIQRKTIVSGSILAALVFAAIAGPYIIGISKQAGYFTVGDSARINYVYFIDEAPRWHGFHSGNVGHALPQFKHPEQLILGSPAIYSYAGHAFGTYPLWFDPNYYTAGLKPHFWLHGHIHQLMRNPELLIRFLFGHPEPFVLFLVLLAMGAALPRGRSAWLPWIPVIGWGLLMLGIYFPVDLQDRYLTAPFLLVVIPCMALLRRDSDTQVPVQQIAAALALLLALMSVTDAARDIFERRRTLNVAGYPQSAYSPEIYSAGRGIAALGIVPGDKVACMGDTACYLDQYWARLAGTQILAEIEVPKTSMGNGDPEAYWKSLPNQQQVVSTLAAGNIQAIVAVFPPSDRVPEGWHQLGESSFYAYPLLR